MHAQFSVYDKHNNFGNVCIDIFNRERNPLSNDFHIVASAIIENRCMTISTYQQYKIDFDFSLFEHKTVNRTFKLLQRYELMPLILFVVHSFSSTSSSSYSLHWFYIIQIIYTLIMSIQIDFLQTTDFYTCTKSLEKKPRTKTKK